MHRNVCARVCVVCVFLKRCANRAAEVEHRGAGIFTANGNLYVWPTTLFPNIHMRYLVKIAKFTSESAESMCANDQGLPVTWNKDYPCCIIPGVLHSRNLWASIFLKIVRSIRSRYFKRKERRKKNVMTVNLFNEQGFSCFFAHRACQCTSHLEKMMSLANVGLMPICGVCSKLVWQYTLWVPLCCACVFYTGGLGL